MNVNNNKTRWAAEDRIPIPLQFPIQADSPSEPRTYIPWWLAEVAYQGYAKAYPSSARQQSLIRLAQRGGFGRAELLSLIRREFERE